MNDLSVETVASTEDAAPLRRWRAIALGPLEQRLFWIVVAGLLPLILFSFATLLYNAWGSVSRAMLRIARGQRHAVVEVGIADKGQMRQYARVVQPDVTVVTSIGSEHHRSLGSLDVTRDEKAWMVRALPPGGTAARESLAGAGPRHRWPRAGKRDLPSPRGTTGPEACPRV